MAARWSRIATSFTRDQRGNTMATNLLATQQKQNPQPPYKRTEFMARSFSAGAMTLLIGTIFCVGGDVCSAADEYDYDLVHSSVSFKARHLNISWIHGRFNDVSGKFSLDREDPSKSTFELTIKADSIDTANKARDEHLRQPDYFDTKQFPTITFKSTSTKAIKGGYEVTGDFTMHGKTNSITLVLMGGKEHDFKKVKRVAFSTELSLKRSDYGFDPSAIRPTGIGDKALIMIDCEGVRQ